MKVFSVNNEVEFEVIFWYYFLVLEMMILGFEDIMF